MEPQVDLDQVGGAVGDNEDVLDMCGSVAEAYRVKVFGLSERLRNLSPCRSQLQAMGSHPLALAAHV